MGIDEAEVALMWPQGGTGSRRHGSDEVAVLGPEEVASGGYGRMKQREEDTAKVTTWARGPGVDRAG